MPESVAVAMSGGVDSSVAAALLKDRGYHVTGFTLRRWSEGESSNEKDIEDADQVARKLGIPHHVVSLDRSFKSSVVDYFVSEYMLGRTPNPCAVCNPRIKFGGLFQEAIILGADLFATGHYAVVSKSRDGRWSLRKGKERRKDQSYFLARLDPSQLARTLFPVGVFSKQQIRGLARQYRLPVAEKKESQEVCFIPDGNVAAFIERQCGRSFPQGPILDTEGRIVGRHHGIIHYTIGQRKGLGIALGRPVYVIRIDAESNTITIGDEKDLCHSRFMATGAHWISSPPERVMVKIRYKHRPARAEMKIEGDRVQVIFDSPQRAITPGQLAVFYDRDRVSGSAWIDRIEA